VPFTLSHAAAALPFRRTRLVPSALLIGTFAPDLEYFVRLQAGGGWGHRLPGIFLMSLPLGIAVLWLFHRFVKVPLVYLLPNSVRARLTDQLAPFRFGPPLHFLNIVVSILTGIATHIGWDALTHRNYGIVTHFPSLMKAYHLPLLGWYAGYGILQLISSVVGLAILAVWCRRWYRLTQPDTDIPANPFTPRHRHVIVAIGIAAATAGAILRAWISIGVPATQTEADGFINQIIVTFGALVWWQLGLWGLLGPFRPSRRAASEEETYMQSRASLKN
jgi:hypothetical protein